MEWIDVKKRTPKITKFLTSHNVLFCCDNGKVDAGHYHENGFFYGIDISAHTIHSLGKYESDQLPVERALFWCEFPEPPST